MAGVLLIGNLRSSLTVARRLSQAGHAVHCSVDHLDPFLFTSRHVQGVLWSPPPDREPDACVKAVADYLAAHPEIDALYPMSNVAVALVSRRRDGFPAHVRLILAEARVIEACNDKAGMFELCDRIGVPIARRRLVNDMEALERAVADVGRPCVIKPVGAAKYLREEKALVLDEGQPLSALLPEWPEEHAVLCVQRFVRGLRHDVDFAAAGGRLLGAVQCVARRTDRLNGTGHMTEKVTVAPLPQVRAAVERLVEALDYTGVGNVQFVVDPATGETTYVENNPRLAAGFKIAEISGLPLALWNYLLWTGRAPARRADPWAYPIGRRLVWTKGELSGLARAWRERELTPAQALRWATAAVLSLFARHHSTFSVGDPVPSLWIYLQAPLKRLGIAPGTARLKAAAPVRSLAVEPQPAG